jgi:prephenate dehydrogenase
MKARPTVVIAGLGLVGGSLARALPRQRWRVLGVDRAPVLRKASAAGVIEGSFLKLEVAAREADIVVLAAPPEANVRLLQSLAAAGTAAVVTDVGSVKGPICREARRLGLRLFVGGHPMAGTEASGFGASTADLFRRRPWILMPAVGVAGRRVRALVRAVGARPVVMTAAAHDRSVAFLSHVPQLASWAIEDALEGDPIARRYRHIAGPGFHDMTRLAHSPRPLWRDILLQNRHEVLRALTALERRLRRSTGALRGGR